MTRHPNVDIGILPNDRVFEQINTLSEEGDHYKFQHTGGNINLVVTNVLGGTVNITLYNDLDQDGQLSLDDLKTGIRSKIGSNTTDAVIFVGNTQAQAGSYIAVVNGSVAPGNASINYRFFGSNTGTNESNVIGASAKVTSNADFQFSPLSDKRTCDFYEFHGLPDVGAKVTVTPSGGKVKVRLIQDINPIPTTKHVVDNKDKVQDFGVISQPKTLTLAKGTDYFVQVSRPANSPGQSINTDVRFQFDDIFS